MNNLNLLIGIILMLFVLACDNTKKENTKKKLSNSNSRVLVTLNGKDYSSPVRCTYFEHDYFYFKSDKYEMEDTNGDGLIINGHQKSDKIAFTLVINGKTYSAANLDIQKKDNTAIGAGKLFSGTESFNATYKVTCN